MVTRLFWYPTAKILADEDLVEFIAFHDQFMTPSGRFADLVLPACTQFESWGLQDVWKYGDEVMVWNDRGRMVIPCRLQDMPGGMQGQA